MNTYAQALSALSDPTRRRIFEQLRTGSGSVGELARDMPVSRPAVSQHLAVLKRAGLVNERRVGNRRVYSAEPEGLAGLRDWLERFWADVLGAYERAAPDETTRDETTKNGQTTRDQAADNGRGNGAEASRGSGQGGST